MKNSDIEATWRYHNGTKHPNGELLNRSYTYYAALRPTPYKIYKGTKKINLILDRKPVGRSTLDAISTNPDLVKNTVDLYTLSRILYFSAGITKKIKFPPPIGEFDFRAASCTGALYHIEIYVVCCDIAGLDAGIYHFEPKEMKLDILRKGDFREILLNATSHDELRHAPVVLVFTDVFARNSIKYQAREYRHAFWDCGTILANTLSITSAHNLSSKIITGFVDSHVNNLLGLDSKKEASLVVLPIGYTEKSVPNLPMISPIDIKSIESDNDIEYQEINAMHDASSLAHPTEVTAWRKKIIKPQEGGVELVTLEDEVKSNEMLEQTIIKRGSTRVFSHESIALGHLSTILKTSTNGVESDVLPKNTILNDIYLIVNSVDGLQSGSYHYIKEKNALQVLRKGNFRDVSGNLGLDQDLPHDASVTIFFMTNLQKILEQFGNRGYRIAQLDAAISGGRMYLSAYALDLGATGLTFYDDLVTEFFSPHARGKECMFLIALGKKKTKAPDNFSKNTSMLISIPEKSR